MTDDATPFGMFVAGIGAGLVILVVVFGLVFLTGLAGELLYRRRRRRVLLSLMSRHTIDDTRNNIERLEEQLGMNDGRTGSDR